MKKGIVIFGLCSVLLSSLESMNNLYEGSNGFVGMGRNVILRLCNIIDPRYEADQKLDQATPGTARDFPENYKSITHLFVIAGVRNVLRIELHAPTGWAPNGELMEGNRVFRHSEVAVTGHPTRKVRVIFGMCEDVYKLKIHYFFLEPRKDFPIERDVVVGFRDLVAKDCCYRFNKCVSSADGGLSVEIYNRANNASRVVAELDSLDCRTGRTEWASLFCCSFEKEYYRDAHGVPFSLPKFLEPFFKLGLMTDKRIDEVLYYVYQENDHGRLEQNMDLRCELIEYLAKKGIIRSDILRSLLSSIYAYSSLSAQTRGKTTALGLLAVKPDLINYIEPNSKTTLLDDVNRYDERVITGHADYRTWIIEHGGKRRIDLEAEHESTKI